MTARHAVRGCAAAAFRTIRMSGTLRKSRCSTLKEARDMPDQLQGMLDRRGRHVPSNIVVRVLPEHRDGVLREAERAAESQKGPDTGQRRWLLMRKQM